MRENHRFLVIQDVERAEPVRELEPPFAGTVFSDNGTIRPCTGCFGCWIKTPGRCVLPDPYRDMGAYLANSGELVLVSRCCFGGPGPFVKNVLDRCISYVHPYFVIKNGEMHHRQRYHHSYGLTVAFYGGGTKDRAGMGAGHGGEPLWPGQRGALCGTAAGLEGFATDIALICGSPKGKNSASWVILQGLRDALPPQAAVREYAIRTAPLPEQALRGIAACDVLVFAMPLYVDGLPSHMVGALLQLEAGFRETPQKERTAYALVNSGFYEGHQNAHALHMLRHWCRRAGVRWGQGIGAGGGGMLPETQNIPMGHGPKKRLGQALQTLAEAIVSGGQAEDLYITQNFPRVLYRMSAESVWRRKGRKNGLSKQELFAAPGEGPTA